METDQRHGWLEDCQRVVTEFNDVAVPAFRQEFGEYEDLLMISMQLQAVEEDIVGKLHAVENASKGAS